MAAQIKDRFPVLQQPNVDIRITAFTNRAGHIALDRGAKRISVVGRFDIHFQQELSLRQADVVRTGCEYEDAAVGCEAVFHREESKRSHDVRAQRRERSVGDLSADTGKIDPASAPRELTASSVNDSAVYRQLRHAKLFGTVGGDHLNECAVFGLSGNERGHVLIVLVLEIPALEEIVFHGMPSGVFTENSMDRYS